jgi:anti-anti-sigma factor
MFVRYSPEQVNDSSSCIQIIGEIDIYSAGNFKNEIIEFGSSACCKNNLLIDCSLLKYMDSQGLNALACLYNKLISQRKKMTLMNTNPNIRKLLHIAELDRVMILEN